METGVLRSHAKVALGTPQCSVCVVFLGQPVPVVQTAHGYALFCETCALGRSAPALRAKSRKGFDIRLDPDPAAGSPARSEEE